MIIINANPTQSNAIEFYARFLGIKDFRITLRKSASENTYCVQEDEFEFSVYMANSEDYLALAHEMVHIKQYINKELLELPYGVMFNGIVYKEDDENYWLHPWEVEAYGKQQGLYQKWRDTQTSLQS